MLLARYVALVATNYFSDGEDNVRKDSDEERLKTIVRFY